MGRIFLVILSIILLPALCGAEDRPQINDARFRDSYSLGYEIGTTLKGQGLDVDLDVLLTAVKDGVEGAKPALKPEEIRSVLKELRRKVMVAHDLRLRELKTQSLAEGKAFLEANKTKEGVRTLPSGLQYIVLSEGDGLVPKATDTVKVQYTGTLVNGAEFDSSQNHGGPAIFRVNSMMPAWTEALQLMKVGSKWKIFVPNELAYGGRQFGRIPPGSALVFEIELLGIGNDLIPKASEQKPDTIQPMPNPSADQDDQLPSGGRENDENNE